MVLGIPEIKPTLLVEQGCSPPANAPVKKRSKLAQAEEGYVNFYDPSIVHFHLLVKLAN